MIQHTQGPDSIEKLATGIPGFDLIAGGGLPKGRTALISGTAGSAKTVFASQFLAEGIVQAGENGVFVTFEESPDNIRRNMLGFGWNIQQWEADGNWAFVDASPHSDDDAVVTGSYDFGALLARIEHAVRKVDAKRLSIDSLGAVFTQFSDASIVRRELFRIAVALRNIGVTSVLTAERREEYGEIARYGVEEFVADNVIILRNVLEQETRRRTVEILKFRGTNHQKGEFPFTVLPNEGIIAIPLSAMELTQKSSDKRVTSGIPELDDMCCGGFFRDSVILVSGATGTGKTLMSTQFAGGVNGGGERSLLFAFEESHDQLTRNAIGWGIDFQRAEEEGRLKVVCAYPESAPLEDHLIMMRAEIEAFKPTRVGVDSLSALERVSTIKSFREFVIGLVSFIKEKEVVGVFTATTTTLMGGTSVTEAHISTITDSIVLLRYVEMYGEMRRGITVLKMRGSMHDKQIREFNIDAEGMHIGNPFRNVTGILSGRIEHAAPSEIGRLETLFEDQVRAE